MGVLSGLEVPVPPYVELPATSTEKAVRKAVATLDPLDRLGRPPMPLFLALSAEISPDQCFLYLEQARNPNAGCRTWPARGSRGGVSKNFARRFSVQASSTCRESLSSR